MSQAPFGVVGTAKKKPSDDVVLGKRRFKLRFWPSSDHADTQHHTIMLKRRVRRLLLVHQLEKN